MAKDGDVDVTQKRKTLSLKVGFGATASKSSSANKTIEVEIKRKRSGLAVDVNQNKEKMSLRSAESQGIATGKLTDSEFRNRVRVLQEAMKEEEEFAASEVELVQESTVVREKTERLTVPPSSFESISPQARRPRKTEQKPQNLKVEPVVFRASDFQKKSIIQSTKPQAEDAKTPNSQSVKEKQYKVKERSFDDVETPKQKIKLVVKATRTPDRRLQTSGKMSRAFLDRVLNNDTEERSRSMASLKRARQKLKNLEKQQEVAKVIREVIIPDIIQIGELSNRMAVRSGEIIKYLFSTGTIVTVNQSIDGETAEVVCKEFGHTPKRVSESDVEGDLTNPFGNPENFAHRAPIVAVMGHVDHGKTTLLDSLRKTSIAQKEAGGITQHVAAYQIDTKTGKKVTFIDTPGHAAFSNIRARGAVITDIIILVVAADDGIKDQTVEVIRQARSQNVPMIVAINKVDKPNINIEKVKSELMTQGIVLEEFGGDVLSVEISAKNGTSLNLLVDAILLQAEMLELKADSKRSAVGVVLESRIDKGKGVVASVIIQSGNIMDGDIFVAGSAFGRVRMIYDDKEKRIASAGPSTPIEIVGFNSSPEPGDTLTVVDSEQKAKEIAEYRSGLSKAKSAKTVLRTMDKMIGGSANDLQILDIIVKADVFGSLEAIVVSLEAIQHPDIKVNIIDKGVGIVSESDVDFAKSTSAMIVGFNVNVPSTAKDLAKVNSIKILCHNIIYRMTEEVKNIMGAMLAPIVEENYIGTADVRRIFSISRIGTIAGCYVIDGVIKRHDSKIKVMRNGKCIFEGSIRSMKHEKDEIKESRQSHECGILADGYNNFIEGDKIECYEIILKSRFVD
ncbi:MAG: translation initiation factor IF-2 [Holosporales bacterium]|jgi:translation initiation factor IF-2|nr:translation initiation factor IF-2 [Holosporales bacterium]